MALCHTFLPHGMVDAVANSLPGELCVSVSAVDPRCPNEDFIVDKITLWNLKSGILYSSWAEIKNVQIKALLIAKC